MQLSSLKIFFLFPLVILPFALLSNTILLTNPHELDVKKEISNQIGYFESLADTITIDELINNAEWFKSYSTFTPTFPLSKYWMNFTLENTSGVDLNFKLRFNNLTYVTLYELIDEKITSSHIGGYFIEGNKLNPFDDRGSFNLMLKTNEKVSYFIEVLHVKGRLPVLRFFIQNTEHYLLEKISVIRIYYLVLGAFSIFIIFSILMFSFSNYTPYLWLTVFTLGVGGYGLIMSGQLFELLPYHPEHLWRMGSVCTNISGIGGFLLLNSFFDLKRIKPAMHKLLNVLALVSFIQLIISQIILLSPHHYNVMTNLNALLIALYLPVLIIVPLITWQKLAKPQRLFSMAVFIYVVLLFISIPIILIMKEEGNTIVMHMNNASGLIAIIFFAVALGEQIRMIEKERNNALQKINLLKEEQNILLEKIIEKRTSDLTKAYNETIEQKELLSQRNEKIELLLKELHHRVKNNLQLISSFYELRGKETKQKNFDNIIEEGQNRIRVMALVHNLLYNGDAFDEIDVKVFITQLSEYFKINYIPGKKIEYNIECPSITLELDTVLPLGLILNEILTNVQKHAKTLNNCLIIKIELENTGHGEYKLEVSDNGEQIEDFSFTGNTKSFGINMIRLLSRQMAGEFTYRYNDVNIYKVSFKDTSTLRKIL